MSVPKREATTGDTDALDAGGDGADDRDADVRVGADIGGTFTDVVLQRGEHRWSTKILTDHAAPERAILDGIRELADRAGIPLPSIGQVVHGTTLVTNALIERRGARVAFITTRGFRDVIEMRSENRFEQYDLNLSLPEPLVPREDRFVIGERIAADGEVLLGIDEGELDALVERIVAGGFEAVAIGLLHAYAGGAHEQRVADAVRRRAPTLFVSCSSVVSPRMRELERFNTVIANAYVQPRVADYLARLRGCLRSAGIGAPVFLMHSGGGLIALDTAIEQPVRLLESGPAGGAVFAARCAEAHALSRVLSFDMGGTTAKICLIEGGRPSTSSTFEVARSYRFRKGSGMTVSTPVVDMVEIGAGGGSIAQRDRLGRIAVGPRSAGSEPGPACYGRGGTEPTVSDANLLLGRLSGEHFADGAIALDASLAATAVRRHLAAPDTGTAAATATDTATLAFAITELVDENMANAARVHAVESGRDIERFTMVAFGGGAPLHACRLCEKLGIDTLLIPVGAGVGSALGFLDAPVSCEIGRGLFQRLAAFDTEAVNALLGELEDEARRFVAAGTPSPDTPVQASLTASMRYAGQGWEIPVALPLQPFDATAAVQLGDAFDAAYRALFGRTIDGLGVEVTNWSVAVASVVPAAARIERRTAGPVPDATTSRRLFDTLQRTEVEACVVQRAGLAPGDTLPGPAVVVERETSTIVTSAFTLTVQDDGSLLLRRRRSKPEPEPESETRTEPRGASANRTGEIDLQVMWNRLIAVVEEQATTLIRTAFSTSVREAGDLSAGLFDRRGRMMAQAVTGTPGHVNAMAESVAHFVLAIGADRILEGDVYITNDPWLGTGHLHDVTVVTPVFRKAVHIGFFACTAHVVDIGGRGFGPDGDDVYEEGLQIPIMKLVDRGELSTVLMRIVRANVREPDQVIGDIHSLIACNAAGERRLAGMLEEFGIDALEALSDFIVGTSLAATRRCIAALPPGAYANTMRVDGFGAPVTMQVLLSVAGDRLRADFAGTSGQSGKGVNVPMVYTRAYACYGLKCAIAPDVPNNAGSLAPFEVVAPEGCILNARRPAPVSVRHVLGHLVPDVVLGALHLCLPDTVPAEGASALWNIQIATRPVSDAAGRPDGGGGSGHEMLMFNSGGTGARPALDGLSATAFPSGVSTMSVEATEQVGPIVVWRKELRENSGGVGRQRGGLGQVIEIEPRAGHEFHFNAMFERIDHPARGRDGGGDGAPGRVGLADGTPLAGKGRQKVSAGQRLVLELPGGGGYGPPSARAAEAVRRDLRAGYSTSGPDEPATTRPEDDEVGGPAPSR